MKVNLNVLIISAFRKAGVVMVIPIVKTIRMNKAVLTCHVLMVSSRVDSISPANVYLASGFVMGMPIVHLDLMKLHVKTRRVLMMSTNAVMASVLVSVGSVMVT